MESSLAAPRETSAVFLGAEQGRMHTLRDSPPPAATYINICFCLHGGLLWPVLSLVAVSLLHTQPITRPWGRGGAGHRGCAAAAETPTPLACLHILWAAAERQQLGLGVTGTQQAKFYYPGVREARESLMGR